MSRFDNLEFGSAPREESRREAILPVNRLRRKPDAVAAWAEKNPHPKLGKTRLFAAGT